MFLWRLPIILKKLEDHVEAVKARESEPECPRCKTPATFVEETPAFDVIYRERRYWCTKCGYRTARLHKIMVA